MEAAEIKQANQDFSVKLNRHLKQLTKGELILKLFSLP